MQRRQFMKLSLAASSSMLVGQQAFGKQKAKPTLNPDPAMLTIFLRGGNDWTNTIIPYGDADYSGIRSSIAIPAGRALMLSGSNDKVGLHPSLSRLHAMFEGSAGSQQVALIHRIGNLTGKRSHFTEQDIMESGEVVHDGSKPGWLPQMVYKKQAYSDPTKVMSLTRVARKLYSTNGIIPSAHFDAPYKQKDMSGYREVNVDFGGSPSRDSLKDALSSSLQAALSGPTPDDYLLRLTGSRTIEAVADLGQRLPGFQRNLAFEAPGDPYFLNRVEDAVQLMDKTDARFIGVDVGGFDTHKQQNAPHGKQLALLDQGIAAAYRSLANTFSNFLILVMSEFGRTVEVNGNAGTDHGVGGGMILIGPKVNPGLYNCHHPSWNMTDAKLEHGDYWKPMIESTHAYYNANGGPAEYRDAIFPAVDFRAPFAELSKDFLGLSPMQIEQVMGLEWKNFALNQTQSYLTP